MNTTEDSPIPAGSAAGTALPAPRTLPPRSAPVLRWGVLGPGGIADTFVRALQASTAQEVVAVGSRSAERAEAFARRLGIPTAYGGYAELLADERVDIVYVATPHSEHFTQAMQAIGAGKHVLVEKAFTRNAREAEQLIGAARAQGRFLMEAMWPRCLPHMDVVRQCLERELLGEVHTVMADHGQYMTPDPHSRLYAPELAGGALLDLGVYPLSFASMVLGPFATASAIGSRTFTGVDAQSSVVVTNARGAHGLLHTTLLARTPTTASVSGSLAGLELEGAFYAPTSVRLLDRAGQLIDCYEPESREHGYAYEAAEAARCVAEGRLESDLMPVSESLRLMRTTDDLREQLGVRYPGE
ncbi:Gfo/Idh/MocA family oxidoreductase [Streptomyces sp. NPDC006649]|uniref:Gfo/Idh/MocA family protein n=1 Tax=Streptomyces sp. NPDC006649 TaxID=3156896 RepID=UPI0033B538C0